VLSSDVRSRSDSFVFVSVIDASRPALVATLMRSRDPSQEFADMAGKALMIEFLVDNAPIVFQD
jgi:hypothetical protein